MPSRKPRLALTVPDELMEALTALGKATGKPASAVTVEMLMETLPVIVGTTKMIIQAKAGNKAGVKRTLTHMVGDQAAAMLLSMQTELPLKGKK